MTALIYFIFLIWSKVGLLSGPTTSKTSVLRRLNILGCIARRYVAKVKVQAVFMIKLQIVSI